MAAAAATAADTPDGGQSAADAATAAASATGTTAAVTIVDSTNDFYSTGRVGRRNAMPDILHQQHQYTSTAGLAGQLGALSTRDEATAHSDAGAGCSKALDGGADPQKAEAGAKS